jgi:hypothetical protein
MTWRLADSDVAEGDARKIDAGTDFGPSLTARILATLFAAGATLALLTAALPHSAHAEVTAVLVIAGIAYAVAALLHWRADWLNPRILPPALASGTTLITGVAYFSAQNPSPLIFLYLWVFLYSAYFFSARAMALQIAYVAVANGALLLTRAPA